VGVVNALVPSELRDVSGPEPVHWHAASLAGEALLDLDLQEKAGERPHHQALLRRVRRWLAALVEGGQLAPRERVAAGDVLGRLGDPRPGVGIAVVNGVDLPDILWVEIPGGPFLMGSAEGDSDALSYEKPQHELTVPTYYIARYPVTNAQFRPFVEGDGYDKPAYWTEQGWAWRQGAEPGMSPWEDYSDKDYVRRLRDWLAGRPKEKRDCPFWWGDPRWAAPTRPVVGVTWFEAVAYARWMESQLKVSVSTLNVWVGGSIETVELDTGVVRVQLPSEAEWEKAARGVDGLRYPWGGEWQADRGNIEETGIEETNAVGCFPRGESPYGVLEMSGNVWEWTRSRWGEQSVTQADYGYPYDPADGRERLEDMKVPVLRGGSWPNHRRNARCAYRGWLIPDLFFDFSGFRVVVSLERF
jgi:formylglycine-generating enzyme required for sulfatase activity